MKSTISICIIGLALVSCATDEPEKNKEVDVEVNNQPQSLIIGDPLDCGLEGTLMFPIGTSYDPEVFDPPPQEVTDANGVTVLTSSADGSTYNWNFGTANNLTFSVNTGAVYDKMAAIEYINDRVEDYDITNILFYDLESGDSYPLIVSDTLHIISFAIHKEYDRDLIFYRAVRDDFNGDDKFNEYDPIMLFVSDLDGDSLIQVTPSNQQFIDYTYYEEHNKILCKTRIDSNNDSLFSPADETNFVEMNLSSPAVGKPLFPENLKAVLKGQLNL